jgi:hypothetical protein
VGFAPVDLARCLKPQSVSPAPNYIVATWLACTRVVEPDTSVDKQEASDELPIQDSIASASGGAFVAYLANGEWLIGRGKPAQAESESRIKGTRMEQFDNMLGTLAVSNIATRLAMITDNKVRIVSLANNKLLLSELAPLAQQTDGQSLAYVWPSAAGGDTARHDRRERPT